MKNNKLRSMSWYFDRGLEKNALLLDASNLDWFEFPLFDIIKKEIYKTLEDSESDMDWGYSYPGGKTKLRQLIAEHETFIEKNNIIKEDVIVVGNGVTGVLNSVSQFLKSISVEIKKNSILYPVPAYSGLLKSLDFYGFNSIKINTNRKNNFSLTFEDIKKNYTEDTLAILITNPGNPACDFIKKNELTKIIDFAMDKKIYIIYDAIFEEAPIIFNEENPFTQIFNLSNNYENLIKIKGLSKDIPQLSDLRLGWSISKNKKFNKYVLDICEITNFSNSTFLESLAIKEMSLRVQVDKQETDYEVSNYLKEKKIYQDKINDGIKSAINFLQSCKIINDIVIPKIGNILFFKFDDKILSRYDIKDSHDLFVYILEKNNILITPGHVFGLPNNELWVRVTFSRNKIQFLDGLKKIVENFEVEI